MDDGRTWELIRFYEDFYDLYTGLLAEIPTEARETEIRKLTMAGLVLGANDDMIRQLPRLRLYFAYLLRQPPHISKSVSIRHFFTPRDVDDEIDPVDWSEHWIDGKYTSW